MKVIMNNTKMYVSGPMAYIHGPQSCKHPWARFLPPTCALMSCILTVNHFGQKHLLKDKIVTISHHCRVKKWWHEAGWRQGLPRGPGGALSRRSVGDCVWWQLGHKGSLSGVSPPELPQCQRSCCRRSVWGRYVQYVLVYPVVVVSVFFM